MTDISSKKSMQRSVNLLQYYMRLKKWSSEPNVQKYLTLGLSFGLITLFLVFAISPTLNTITDLKKSIKESEKVLKKLRTKSKNLERVNAVWNQSESYIKSTRSVIPITPEYVEFVKQIENLADASGVVYEQGYFGDTIIKSRSILNDGMDIVAIKASITISGEFSNIMRFVRRLSRVKRVFEMSSLTFSKVKDKNSEKKLTPTVKLSISGNVFRFANEKLEKSILNDGGKNGRKR